MGAPEPGTLTLPPMLRAVATEWLQEPWLPAAVVDALPTIVAAAATGTPLTLWMPAGAARQRIVRALAATAGCAEPIAVWNVDSPRPPGDVVLVEPAIWTAARWLTLTCALDDDPGWLIVVAAPESLGPPVAVHGLGLVTLEVPRLCLRSGATIALAQAYLARLAARAGCAVPPLDPAALGRLEHHLWPGDQDELETALRRAFLRDRTSIRGDALRLEADVPGDKVVMVPVPAVVRSGGVPDARLETLLAEMAHELRNPLVTIKTFADHLPALLEDAALRERFQGLTNEAIERMETVLDNVLAYGRLGTPGRVAVDMPPLLDEVLAEVQPALAERGIVAARTGALHATCTGDPAHLHYALRNLLAGVAREMPPGQPLGLDASANGVVRLQFAPGGTTAARLRALAGSELDEALRDPTLLPLSFTLARAVVERLGGQLGVTTEDTGTTTLVVQLPTTT